jgi:two-component system KDP operon response regulator KdpE
MMGWGIEPVSGDAETMHTATNFEFANDSSPGKKDRRVAVKSERKGGAYRPVIIVVEDDQSLRNFLRTGLWAHGYDVVEADSGNLGLKLASARNPDLIILDLGLPDIDGVEVVAQIRQWSTAPVIALSARTEERDKVDTLEAGADDYITKPFGLAELVARIQAALRRTQMSARQIADGTFTVKDLVVDVHRRRVTRGGTETHLTPKEFRLLETLIRHAGRVVTHKQLMTAVWGPKYENKTHYLRIYMAALRDKLEADSARPELLITEPGSGYRLATDDLP